MYTLDGYLIDRMDALMTWAQKRGVSLVSVRCLSITVVMLLTAVFYFFKEQPVSMVIFGGGFGVLALVRLEWAKTAKDYRENWRLTQRLNGEVLQWRECRKLRVTLFSALCVLTAIGDVPGIISGHWPYLISLAGTVLVVADGYLSAATFYVGTPRAADDRINAAVREGA